MTPRRIIADYNSGRITATNAYLHLCEASLEHDIEEFVQEVPEEVLAFLRTETQPLPNVGRVYRLDSMVYTTPIDPKERERREAEEMNRRATGLRTWKAYFDAQMPQG